MPVNYCAWSKTFVEWLVCDEITQSGTYTVKPSALNPECYRMTLTSKDQSGYDEYLLIENRQQQGFDTYFWTSGLAIYHIDDAANGQYDRGFPGQQGWPSNGVSINETNVWISLCGSFCCCC